jgi:hypothetical protein
MFTPSTARKVRKTQSSAWRNAVGICRPAIGLIERVGQAARESAGYSAPDNLRGRDPMAPCWNANTYGPRTFPLPRPEF